jgi:hypothetical protein
MVNMGMGDDDLLDSEVVLFQHGKNPVDIRPGIDDRGPQGSLIRENAAVTGERADGKNLVNHSQRSSEE